MCGIVGYIGKRNSSFDIHSILIGGIERLEYRGYDSAGIATIEDTELTVVKVKGRIRDLKSRLSKIQLTGNLGIAHTRWATHGEPSERNAHPHLDCSGKIALVHNGIIENYNALRELLESEGHIFKSETDTETLCHLIERFYKGDLVKAAQEALALVEGAYAIAVICKDEPDKLVVARLGSPLVIGICGTGEYIVASDVPAILEHTRKVIYLNDEEMAVLTPNGYRVMTTKNVEVEKSVEKITWSLEEIQKGGHPHFMLKEIYEQPNTIRDAMRGRLLENEGKSKLGGLDTRIERLNGTAFEQLLKASA